jgi:uncharacterized protein (TIGR03435 family)
VRRLHSRLIPIGLAVVGAAATVHLEAGQAPSPAFDVASVRRSPDAPFGFPGLMLQPGGRALSPGTSVRQLILTAYGLQELQLIGGPAWIGSELYAIDARAGESATRASVRLMLRALLRERFQLAVRSERRELPAYALVLASLDGRIGPRLRPSGPDCAPITPPPGIPPPPPPPSGAPEFVAVLPNDPLGFTCGYVSFPGWIAGRQLSMAQLVQPLTQLVRRPIVDETGLDGAFDVDLFFTPDHTTGGGMPAGNVAAAAPPPGGLGAPYDRPSLFTAIQEDLGLKLDPRRRVVDVLFIDRVERPSEN